MDVNAEGKRIRETFEGNADKALEKLRKKLEKGTATYADVLKYASETGQEAGRVLAEELPALYPDGVIPEADAARLLPPTLRSNNAMVLEAAGQVQKAKNLKEGVQLNAVLPEYNADYEQMLIQRVAEVVKTDKFWTHTFPQSVENMAMCAVDDTVRANADFQVRSGIHRKIRRQTVGKCCQWCSDLAGTYDYEDVNNAGNDVWRRHKNCDCLIEDVRDGRRGEVFNYREANTPRGRLERERRRQNRIDASERDAERKRERHLTLGEERSFERDYEQVSAHKLSHYTRNNLYMADNVALSSREIRHIDHQITMAKDVLGVSDQCKAPVVIVDDDRVLASYNPRTNVFYISSRMVEDETIIRLQQGFAAANDTRSTMVHELFHWNDATEYRKGGRSIDSAEPESDYSLFQRERAEKALREAGVNLDSVEQAKEISDYAYEMMLDNDFEEVYTEYRTQVALMGE